MCLKTAGCKLVWPETSGTGLKCCLLPVMVMEPITWSRGRRLVTSEAADFRLRWPWRRGERLVLEAACRKLRVTKGRCWTFKKGNWLKDRRDGSSTLQRASGKNTAEMDVMKGQCQRLPRWILWRASARDCRDGRDEGPVPETAETDVMKGQCHRLPRWTLWRLDAGPRRSEGNDLEWLERLAEHQSGRVVSVDRI